MIRLLLTLAICTTFCFSHAQDYLPMLNAENVWSTDIYNEPFDPDCTICGCCAFTVTQQVTVSGSVVVNGQTYKRVLNNQGETSCLVREDNGFIYKYSDISEEEVLYYDFTLELGDIFNLPQTDNQYCGWEGFNNSVYEMEVINVSTQSIAGEDRKVIEFDFSNELGINETWIEGIGSVLGFDPIGETIDFTFGTALACFTNNGDTTFFNGATSCDNTTLNVDDFPIAAIVLYPNPVITTSVLQFSAEGIADMVQIYNVSGSIVKELRVTSGYVLINAMDYRAGLYFYQVSSEGRLLKTEKFIVR